MTTQFELLAMVWPDKRMDVAAFEALVRQDHGVPPILHKMEIRERATGDVCQCWASWGASHSRKGSVMNIRTAAGTVVHTFSIPSPMA